MGLRARLQKGHLRAMRHDRRLAVVCILLISSYASANSIPKFPGSSHEGKHHRSDQSLSLHTTSHRAVQSEELAAQPDTKQSSLQQLTNLFSKNGGKKHQDVKLGVNRTANGSASSNTTAVPDPSDTGVKQEVEIQSLEPSEEASGGDFNFTVKTRLRPHDIFNKGTPKPQIARLQKGQEHTHQEVTDAPPRSKILDIVIAHYAPEKTEEMVDFWLNFLLKKKVQEMKPYVYIYCQNEEYDIFEEHFMPILQLGGEVIHTANIGRESHAYLEHIINHYNDLAEHTLFAQDIADVGLPDRFEMLFEPRTGFLPLSLVGHVDCNDPWLPKGLIPQIYSMLADELCPPVGYTSSFQGQFIVSKKRILSRKWWTFRRLLDLLSADTDHWIHDTHDIAYYKDKSNPMFGHVLERSWSLAFNCFESWREGNCWQCIAQKGMVDCNEGDCQCFDKSKT